MPRVSGALVRLLLGCGDGAVQNAFEWRPTSKEVVTRNGGAPLASPVN
jgi:hypothetical protein